MSNAERAKRYRERIKASPEKAQAWRNKAASRMRKKRSVAQHDQTVAQQKRKPTPEERAALLAAFDEPAALPVAQQVPVPLVDHPWCGNLLRQIPCTLVRNLEPKPPKLDNSANKLPRLPGETTEQLSLRRNQAWYEANKARLAAIAKT